MPQLLNHIDFIARQKQRDVLLIEFHNRETGFILDYTLNQSRKTILDWLTANDIPHCECAGWTFEKLVESYRGQIYLDIPYDDANTRFQRVKSFLDNPDGSSKFDGAWLCNLPLQIAMQNAHHDLPGFWGYMLAKL